VKVQYASLTSTSRQSRSWTEIGSGERSTISRNISARLSSSRSVRCASATCSNSAT